MRGGPFADVAPVLVVAAGYATVAWGAAITGAPGARWTVVHLLTLGVASNLIVAFSQQFARAVTHARAGSTWQLLVPLNVAVVVLIVGLPTGTRAATVSAAATVTAVVLASLWRLRRMHRAAPDRRFAWLLGAYQRAHGAFVFGAILGGLLGGGILPARWYESARLAHLHLNLAGWVGLTLLATAMMFGPAMLRTRIPEATQAAGAKALRRGAAGLGVAAVALLASALPPPVGALLRGIAAGGLAVYATAVLTVARLTLVAAREAKPSPARQLLPAAMLWFAAVALADVVVVATGAWRWLDPLGVAFGAGVAIQSFVAVAVYLLPSLRGRDLVARDVVAGRAAAGARTRAWALNAAVAAVTAGAALHGPLPSMWWRAGWATIATVVVATAAVAAMPLRAGGDPVVPRSASPRC